MIKRILTNVYNGLIAWAEIIAEHRQRQFRKYY